MMRYCNIVGQATLPAAAFQAALRRLKAGGSQGLPHIILMTLCVSLTAQTLPPRNLTLVVGKGHLLQFNNDVSRVVLAEPKIADAVVVGPREVMVNAKSPGKTTLVIWEAGSLPATYDVSV